jgi:hypothetical protein
MTRPLPALLGCAAALAAGAALRAEPPAKADPAALAAAIDRHLDARRAAANVPPAPPADDAEFLRRAYLHLVGRIPTVAEARQFLDDPRPEKRRQLIDRLLDEPRYVTHFVHVWRALLLPEVEANAQLRGLAPGFDDWLRFQLARNASFRTMVRELLTAPLTQQGNMVTLGRRPVGAGEPPPPTPVAYYQAKELKPENLAAGVARTFLGMRLECAQCHDHPFADWKRDQFWAFAAFFAGVRAQGQGDGAGPAPEVLDKRELTVPGSDRVVQAAYPDGTRPKLRYKQSPRVALADWVTAPQNPYFARATVNRVWASFVGRGLIDPVDEMVGAGHEPSHPALLDELAKAFIDSDFDLKYLIRAVTATQAYQRGSAVTHPGKDDASLFARMPVHGLTAEQLFDSLATAVGFQAPAGNGEGAAARSEFLARFSNPSDRPTEYRTSILQALALMNGRLTADATSLERSEALAAILDAPFLSTADRVETLYLAALCRKPRPEELQKMVRYVEAGSGPADADRRKRMQHALSDVLWALLNSTEFFLNH